jgi:hypothetical protein
MVGALRMEWGIGMGDSLSMIEAHTLTLGTG